MLKHVRQYPVEVLYSASSEVRITPPKALVKANAAVLVRQRRDDRDQDVAFGARPSVKCIGLFFSTSIDEPGVRCSGMVPRRNAFPVRRGNCPAPDVSKRGETSIAINIQHSISHCSLDRNEPTTPTWGPNQTANVGRRRQNYFVLAR
jgi:hypothetical protein